jgi:hypothetical protein
MYNLFIFEITNQIYYFYSLIVSPFFPQSLLLINLGKDQPSNVLSGDKKKTWPVDLCFHSIFIILTSKGAKENGWTRNAVPGSETQKDQMSSENSFHLRSVNRKAVSRLSATLTSEGLQYRFTKNTVRYTGID